MKRLLIGLISHKPLVDFRTMLSIEAAVSGLFQLGWREQRLPYIGSADLAGARNALLSEAYTGGYDKLIFVDADVSWEPGTLERLALHEQDLVGGVYRKKDDEEYYVVRTLPGDASFIDPETGEDQPFGLYEVAAIPTGLMAISRRCMEKMINAHPDLWYRDPKISAGKAWNLFEFSVTDHERMGEDFHFCTRWRDLGEKVWCDPHLMIHHHGDKTYSGCFAQHLHQIGRARLPIAAE